MLLEIFKFKEKQQNKQSFIYLIGWTMPKSKAIKKDYSLPNNKLTLMLVSIIKILPYL